MPFKASAQSPVGANVSPKPVGITVGGDNLTRLLWKNLDGSIALWKLNGNGSVAAQNSYGPYPGWLAQDFAAGPDSFARVLWGHPADGQLSVWRVDPSDASFTQATYGPYPGWSAVSLGVGGNNAPRILWNHTADNQMSLWNVTPDTNFTSANYGPYTGYTAFRVAAGPNSIPRTFWNKSDGSISLWYSTADAGNYAHSEYGPFAGYAPVALTVDSTNAPRILWSHPSDGTVSLWNVAANGTYTFQNFTNPAGYFPVALAAGTGGDVRLLWSNGQGGAIVWTIQQNGAYAQTYPAVGPPPVYPKVIRLSISPSTITANDPRSHTVGNTATLTVYLEGSTTKATTVSLSNNATDSKTFSPNNTWLNLPEFVSVPIGASSVAIPFTAAASVFQYSSVTIGARNGEDNGLPVIAPVIVFTPSGVGNGPGVGDGGTGTGGDQSHGMTITLPGTIGTDSNLHILIGQGCAGVLNTNGIPPSWVTNLQWTVSGQTVQSNSWSISLDHFYSSFSGPNGAYTFAQATPSSSPPSWYWDDLADFQTVTCSATVTPPTGQGSSYTIVATRNVYLDAPKYSNFEPIGVVSLDDQYLGALGTLEIHAGAGADRVPGIYFKDTVTTNPPGTTAPKYSGTGTWYRIQLSSVSRYETSLSTGTVSGAPGNSVKGALDASPGTDDYIYNYNQIINADGTLFDSADYDSRRLDAENDSPAFPVFDAEKEYNVKNEKFEDYIMYTPPPPSLGNGAVGTSITVPLFYYQWSWNVDVISPTSPLPRSWSNWNKKPTGGVITPPSGTQRIIIYPTWSSIATAATAQLP